MSRKRSSPGRGKPGAPSSFSYWGVPVSVKPLYAWVAGECEWYEVHEHTPREHGTKVCLRWYTDGALRCPRCRPLVPTTTIGYLPIYRESDLKPCVLLLHESVADLVTSLRFRDYIMIGRVDVHSSTFAKKAETRETFASVLPSRQSPCDLLPSLLTMWGYPELNHWIATHGDRVPVSPAVPAKKESQSGATAASGEKDVRGKLARHMIDQAGGEQPAEITTAQKRALVNRLTEGIAPPPNGKYD